MNRYLWSLILTLLVTVLPSAAFAAAPAPAAPAPTAVVRMGRIVHDPITGKVSFPDGSPIVAANSVSSGKAIPKAVESERRPNGTLTSTGAKALLAENTANGKLGRDAEGRFIKGERRADGTFTSHGATVNLERNIASGRIERLPNGRFASSPWADMTAPAPQAPSLGQRVRSFFLNLFGGVPENQNSERTAANG